MPPTLKEGVQLVSAERHIDRDAIVVKVYEGADALDEVAAGIILADIARNLEICLGLELEGVVEAFEREMERPTDIPVQPS